MIRLSKKLDPLQTGHEALKLHSDLQNRIVGQDEAIDQIVGLYQKHLSGMTSPGRPVGNLLFLGPQIGSRAIQEWRAGLSYAGSWIDTFMQRQWLYEVLLQFPIHAFQLHDPTARDMLCCVFEEGAESRDPLGQGPDRHFTPETALRQTASTHRFKLHLHLDEIGGFFDRRLATVCSTSKEIGFWQTAFFALMLLVFAAIALRDLQELILAGFDLIRFLATLGGVAAGSWLIGGMRPEIRRSAF